MFQVKTATGCHFHSNELLKENIKLDITEFGAGIDIPPVENTRAINKLIKKVHEAGGGTVVIPKGDFRIYTIHLMSNVNLYLSKESVLHAAKTDIKSSYELQQGEGGNYEEAEVNIYAGLQDHGHTYFANSLIYGKEVKNVMIYGPGLIDGSFLNDKGELEHVLMGGDPHEPNMRTQPGHNGEWFGNKAIALDKCENIALCDFSIVAGGHFAIIATCVINMFVNHILLDTNRDAFDVDCCQNVTILNSTFNSLTDDAIVMKASYGGGIFMPLKNVLIEDCKVSGYDMGSVYSGEYTKDKLIATDRCGPTARVKLGTESTCGYDRVTVRRVEFKRSRGFALEAVDGADLSNILFEDSTLEDVSSSPIFIKVGDRGRFPVTGNSISEKLVPDKDGKPNVRLNNTNWILPNKNTYTSYEAKRYTPSYNRSKKVTVDGHSYFIIVDGDEPCRLNPANYHEENGKFFAIKYDSSTMEYVPDYKNELKASELVLYANASGSESIAKVHDIVIRNITAKNVDPRYPIEIMGLNGNSIENVLIENIKVEYRGGLSLEHAVEQRQLNTNWEYNQNGKKSKLIQSLPWLVNTFFLKNEGLLPRVEWDKITSRWKDAPFNVPELPEVYPEPSNWGILPAYGLYARHVKNLYLDNIDLSYHVEDTRYPIVLDDVCNGFIKNTNVDHNDKIEQVVCVTNNFKRPAGLEYVKDFEYHKTDVVNMDIDSNLSIKQVVVDAPAPGTPKDSLYPYETVAAAGNGYSYPCKTEVYPLPQTVYRPFFHPIKEQLVKVGDTLEFHVIARQPAYEVSQKETDGKIYNETLAVKDFTVAGIEKAMTVITEDLPDGASFDNGIFIWKPSHTDSLKNCYTVTFKADDGIIPVYMEVKIKVVK
ncbi:MAG: hypothetical protein GX913_08925 [Clostridiales bacterium]|nr:hypothetical protein [Clostridiales bacterium]